MSEKVAAASPLPQGTRASSRASRDGGVRTEPSLADVIARVCPDASAALTAFEEGRELVRARAAVTLPVDPSPPPLPVSENTPGYRHCFIPYAHEAEQAARQGEMPPSEREQEEQRARARRCARKKFRAKLKREARRQERRRDAWSKKLAKRGYHCPNPRVATAEMWEAPAYLMSDERGAVRGSLQRLPVGLAEAYLRACWAEGVRDPSTSVTHRFYLSVLTVLWAGSRPSARDGFSRVAWGYGQGLIGALIPRRDGWGTKHYKRRWVQVGVAWLERAGCLHRHQPPPREFFESRGWRDRLPPEARGPSGHAYNQYWFAAEVCRGPRGPHHVNGGLWGFSDDVRDWLLDVDSEELLGELEAQFLEELAGVVFGSKSRGGQQGRAASRGRGADVNAPGEPRPPPER